MAEATSSFSKSSGGITTRISLNLSGFLGWKVHDIPTVNELAIRRLLPEIAKVNRAYCGPPNIANTGSQAKPCETLEPDERLVRVAPDRSGAISNAATARTFLTVNLVVSHNDNKPPLTTRLFNTRPRHNSSPTHLRNTLLQHLSTTIFRNTSLQHFSQTLLSNTCLQHPSPTLLDSTNLFSSTLFRNTSLQHLSFQHFSTTLFSMQPLSTTLFHNTSLQHLSPPYLYNTLL